MRPLQQIICIYLLIIRVRCGILDLDILSNIGILPQTSSSNHDPFPKFQIDIEEAFLRVDQILDKNRYFNTRERVHTTDGYILSIYRVGHPNDTFFDSNKPPVLLFHDCSTTGADFLMLGPGNALGYLLADEGYDVWILTSRGPKESGGHEKYKSAGVFMTNNYWEWSQHEIGVYDFSAAIDHVLAVTERKNVSIVGWSLGAANTFLLLSERPEYNQKINVLVAYAPPALMCNFPHILMRILTFPEYPKIYSIVLSTVGTFNIGPYMPATRRLIVWLCTPGMITQPFCQEYFKMIFSYREVIPEAIAVFLGHNPAESSTNVYIHFTQTIISCKYGTYKHWPWSSFHLYNLDNVAVPTYMYTGLNDRLVSHTDVTKLSIRISRALREFKILPGMGHEDFIIGRSAKERVYMRTIEVLNKHNRMIRV